MPEQSATEHTLKTPIVLRRMTNNTPRNVAVLLSLCFLSFGCVQQKQIIDPQIGRVQRQQALEKEGIEPIPPKALVTEPAPGPVQTDLLLPSLAVINERIYAYDTKKARLQTLIDSAGTAPDTDPDKVELLLQCSRQLSDILSDYNRLHKELLAKQTPSDELLSGIETLLQLEQQDFNFLEGECANIDSKAQEPVEAVRQTKSLHDEKQSMQNAMDAGDLSQVITIYEQLQLAPGEYPPYELSYLYGRALLKNKQADEALGVFKELLSRIRKEDQAQWEFKLMQLIGDLNLGLGQYEEAREGYKELREIYLELGDTNEWAKQQLGVLGISGQESEELTPYAALLKNYLSYFPQRDGFTVVQQAEDFVNRYAYSPVASSVDLLLNRSRAEADAWFNTVIDNADQLSATQKYQDALLNLEQVQKDVLPAPQQKIVREKKEEITTQEAITIESERLKKEQFVQEQWNDAMTSLENRDYDQAIEKFKPLLETEQAVEAQARIDEAAQLAAQEDRRRAAELFVRANRTHDLESRKKLLMGSRRLLQDILLKYPQSDLIDKVERNLQRIEEEINALDPSLLQSPQTVGDPNGESPAFSSPAPLQQPFNANSPTGQEQSL